ncbi:uncharacterized protein [Primulina huaijiensis]|uniref:uncharacterized protein n=1 Tax=Primulina huaijiensis TaxID=1492673 RepID=UPI003CC6FF85
MISGGSTDGDSNRARKARSRRECLEVDGRKRDEPVISFGPEDLRGVSLPHNDALVIQARVANYDVLRVFVDNGSSGNVIFKEALGEIILPLTLGTGDLRKTVMTVFTVIDAPSSYNIILGRPAMNEMRAVASTYHQKIKFPVRGHVGEVKGDQPSSRKCYGETVRVDQKKARNAGKEKEYQEGANEGEVHFVAEEEQEVVEVEPGKHIRVARDICPSTRELTGISSQVAEHKLNILPGSRPVKQKKWHFGPEKDKVIEEQGYHQIPLALEDQDKASFITSGGTFCYVVMPFGLKNAGATYQRLMNLVFYNQISRNIEVLRKVQKFGWDDRCEQAFHDLKRHLAELPILAKPESGENLWVYLSATEFAVSSVLVKEEWADQKPIYYVSHALRGAELKYSELEKIALALVIIARKLRPYFLSHPIVVLTKSPLGRIMTHAEVSGRMVKWTVELGEYDIEYKPRAAIKAQALTDFLIEMIQPVEKVVWRVFVDGASNLSGCGVGGVLIAPSEEKIKLALRIDSRVTNNEAEYEAVLAGLQAVQEVGAARVIIYSDSQLITQQIKGMYEAKNEKMLKYLGLITAQAASLTDWSIEQIPREKNAEADTLAKLAASMSDISTREVLCFTQLLLSIDEKIPSIQKSSWMIPIIEYIIHEKLPENRAQAAKIRKQAPTFVFLNNVLYRRSYQGPLLKCLSEDEVAYVLREIHEGCCGEHLGGTALSRKAILAGFWWPRMN